MGLSRLAAKRIEALKASMPGTPIRDAVVGHAGRQHREIAEIYRREGDLEAAADWYMRAVEFSRAGGDIMGAATYAKRGMKLFPSRHEFRGIHAELMRLLGLDDEPEPVE